MENKLTGSDPWAAWLLKNRHGGSEEHHRQIIEHMAPVRDRVLTNAHLASGETLLDVGTGDGLIGFGAMEKVGADGRVIFSDISEKLLEVCKECATETGLIGRSEFLKADAIDLSAVESESIDAVTTRSVIIYVQEKQRAFEEFFRVLKKGGRVSMFEPIGKLGFEFVDKANRYLGYDVQPIKDLMQKIDEAHKIQKDSQSTMGDFDERDLVKMLEKASFGYIHLELDVTLGNAGYGGNNWEVFYNSSPNPLVPTLREQAEAALTLEEQERLIAHLKPLVETNTGRTAQCLAYITAVKEDWGKL
ncbi:MAG: class I SAM-dependent methyltransferase [Candidatus Kapaibacterium sp.]